MKDLLILYPHGLGDCILLTPAIREFCVATGNKVHLATLQRFKTAKIFDHNPYIDKIYYTKDAWHDYDNSHLGFQTLHTEWKRFAKNEDFAGFVMPMHSSKENKTLINCRYLGIPKPKSFQTEVYTTEKDKEAAAEIISKLVGSEPFGFVHTNTGVPSKDLPDNFGRTYLRDKGLSHIIELGKEFDPYSENINVQFEILRRASKVCIPDSVFYHACHAMHKSVDFVYFGRGEGIHSRVKPLFECEENVVYKL